MKKELPPVTDNDWDQFDLTNADVTTLPDGYLRLSPGKNIVASKQTYSSDVDIVVVARTNGNNIRLDAFRGATVIFNWEKRRTELRVHRPDGNDKQETGSIATAKVTPLEPNTWYTLRWTITGKSMTVSVNGSVVFEEKRDYNLSAPRPVRVRSASSTVDVKSFVVTSSSSPKMSTDVAIVGGPALLKAPFTKEEAEKARAEWAKFLNIPERKQLDLGKGVKLELVLIPPGQFRMGNEGDTGNLVAHDVTISKPFYMAVTETTQEQFEAVLPGKRPASFSPNGPRKLELGSVTDTSKFPRENVDWHEANDFCLAIKAQLPTEAEWEFACRAGTITEFHFGYSLNGTEANCDGTQPFVTKEPGPYVKRTVQVASYKPNSFGLFDMHGNVSEWCRDWYADKTADLPARDPERAVDSMGDRVLRGGCWGFTVHCRSAHRYHHKPETRNFGWGFRIMVPVPLPDAQAKKEEPKGADTVVAAGPALLKAPFTKEQAEKARAEWAAYLKVPERKELGLGKGAKLPIVLIPPGEFMMGDETKSRKVTIFKPFYMAVTETTQEQYAALIGNNPSGFSTAGSNKDKVLGLDTLQFPVDKVNWSEAVAFGEKFGAQLPSEAQWEYACRAGTISEFHTGGALSESDANIDKKLDRTAKVGSYAPNAFGLSDMHGNIVEWCRDWFDDNIDDLPDTDPERTMKTATDRRAYRGGQWSVSAGECRSDFRAGIDPAFHGNGIGFRVIIPVSVPDVAPKKVEPKKETSIGKHKPGEEVEVEIVKGVKMKFCWVPAGTATLGSPESEKGRGNNENEHKFTTKGFWLGKYEVTQREWQSIMDGVNPSLFVPTQSQVMKDGISDTSRFPVENVSWNDCQQFLKKLNDNTPIPSALGMAKFAMPNGDEWEHACRGGKGNAQPFYFGEQLNGTMANSHGGKPYGAPPGPNLGRPTTVGSYAKVAPHPWGLADMHGNVWEWCDSVDPGQKDKPIRGGTWVDAGVSCRSSSQKTQGLGFRNATLGFRIAIAP